MNKTPAEILEEAADIISRLGHHKGDYQDGENGPVCMLGAINMAVIGRAGTSYHLFEGAILRRLSAAIGCNPISIAEWNDSPETTAEDAILALKRAAASECLG